MPLMPVLPPFFWRRAAFVAGGVLLVLAVAAGGYLAGKALFGDDSNTTAGTVAPAPNVVVRTPQPQAAQDVGFPEFATKNTTRVGGADSIADAAGVALAVHPSAGGLSQPDAVTLVPTDDWQAGIVAAELTAAPVGAPILLSTPDGLPPLSADALKAMAPAGSKATDNKQVFTVGDVKAPSGVTSASVQATDPARLAVGVAALRQKLVNAPPDHLLIVSSASPAYAMPAASWAARSGDPVLFTDKDSLPASTAAALKRYVGTPTYVLGATSVVSDKGFAAIKKIAPQVKRIPGSDPITSAVDFARYSDGTFGWNVNDPGHGFVIANSDRPLDAAAAAPLSASGNWGPLLITDTPSVPPEPLRSYLLDLKPGYETDPTRAVYNHVWLIGDESVISVPFQAEIDALAEVAQVRSGAAGLDSQAGSETEQKKP